MHLKCRGEVVYSSPYLAITTCSTRDQSKPFLLLFLHDPKSSMLHKSVFSTTFQVTCCPYYLLKVWIELYSMTVKMYNGNSLKI